MIKHFLIAVLLLLLAACAPSQVANPAAPAETRASNPVIPPTAVIIPTATITPAATITPTATLIPCTDLGWTDISNYLTEFNFQVGMGTTQGVIVSEWLKTVTGIKDNIAGVTIEACTEPARELVVSSLDNRISAQHMLFTGKFDDPNAITDKLFQSNQMMEAARTELSALGLKVILP